MAYDEFLVNNCIISYGMRELIEFKIKKEKGAGT